MLTFLIAWFLLSIPAALFIGRMIRFGMGDEDA
jgi:hypothetical protein